MEGDNSSAVAVDRVSRADSRVAAGMVEMGDKPLAVAGTAPFAQLVAATWPSPLDTQAPLDGSAWIEARIELEGKVMHGSWHFEGNASFDSLV